MLASFPALSSFLGRFKFPSSHLKYFLFQPKVSLYTWLLSNLSNKKKTQSLYLRTGGVGIVPDDYVDIQGMVLNFNSGVDTIQVNIPIVDDNLCEADEIFQLNLATTDPDVNLNPATGFVTIKDDDGKLKCPCSVHNVT